MSSLRSTLPVGSTSAGPSALPLLSTAGHSIVVESLNTQIDHLCLPLIERLADNPELILVAGFDMEWPVVEGEGEKPVALLQLAVRGSRTILLFQVRVPG